MTIAQDNAAAIRNDIVRLIREAFGLHEVDAVDIAEEITFSVARRLSGVHIPASEIKRARNAAILRDFNGKNHAELAQRYGISRAWVYQILSSNSRKLDK